MDEQAGAHIILFGGFRFDRRRGLLSRRNADGGFAPIAIGSRALDVLGLLIDRKGDVVSRDEILNAVWPGVVEGANVTVQISALRRALDDGGSEGGIIRTIPGRGYCFAAAITRSEADPLATVGGNGADRGEAIQPVSSVATSPRARQRAWHGIAALLVVLTVTASMAAWIWDHWSSGGSDTRPRLSLAVLPFTNLGPDPDRDHLADALNAELTTDLSRIPDIFLISRNSSFTYRSRPVDTRQLGRAPGVRYVLEGSVQRSGDHVRVNIQLIDAETDANLWAERFDGDVGNLFALQDDITRRIAIALNLELINRAAGRPTEHTDALDYILRGRAASNKTPSRAAHMEAILLFERALALDPESIEAQSRLAIALADRVLNNMTDTTAADLDRAEGLIRRALTAAPDSTLAHFANGELLRARRRYAKAIPEYEMVLASNCNALGAYFGLSHAKLFVGSVEEAIPLTEQAIRLSPRDPGLGIWYLQIGRVRSWQSRPAEAIFWLEKARTQIPANSITRSELAAAYALDGQTERAADELAEARRLAGDGRYRSNAHLKAAAFFGEIAPSVHAMAEATLFAGLRKAGMPEQ